MSVLVVDKPRGPTSFDVVRQVRGALAALWQQPVRALKVGHGGTLDPMASGVLPLCVGEATKLAPFLLDADKEYEATLRFGAETDTLDAEGTVTVTRTLDGLSAASLEEALPRLRGAIEQVPPMYAALKRDGRPLYAYARAGETVDRAPRRVTVHELELVAFEPPDSARLRVRCSKGTYVRVLAEDLGRALGPGAHLSALRRLTSGPFRLAAALTLDELADRIAAGEDLPFVSCAEALAHFPFATVSPAIANALRRGQRLAWSDLGAPAGATSGSEAETRVRALEESGALVAVIAPAPDGGVRTLRVFHAPVPSEPWRS